MPQIQRFCILFNGEIQPGFRRDQVLDNISHLTNLATEDLLDSLFSIKPVILNYVENSDSAEAYLKAFQEAGLALRIEPYKEAHDEIINAEIEFSHYAPMERHEDRPNYLIDEVPDETTLPEVDSEARLGPFYRLHFFGKLEPGITKEQAIDNLCHLTKSEPAQVVEQVFSVVPVALIETPDRSKAERYENDFSRAGLKVELSDEVPANEDLALSKLRIRTDAPAPPSVKIAPRFTYLLIGLTALSVLVWLGIYVSNKGYFDQEPQPALEIKLKYEKIAATEPSPEDKAEPDEPIEEIALPKVEKRKIEPPPIEESVTKEIPQIKQVVKEQHIEPPQPTPKPKVVARPAKKTTLVDAGVAKQRLEQIEQQYFIQVLNWFAQPQHHAYDSETRQLNLVGEIKIRISIFRDGKVNAIEVISSTSERLTQETKTSALKASPYPPVPNEITGETYSFTLPLKYKLEGQ